eukprot:3992380-Karenia_brevis.AAC.1
MTTYNSCNFGMDSWPAYEAWAKAFAQKYGARAWAACLERSEHAQDAASMKQIVYHMHAYFFWEDDA